METHTLESQSVFSVGAESLPAGTGGFLASPEDAVFHTCHALSPCVLYPLCIHLANMYCTLNIYLVPETVKQDGLGQGLGIWAVRPGSNLGAVNDCFVT